MKRFCVRRVLDVIIRLATAADLPAINAIYNHYVATSTCTYQYEPETEEGRLAWFTAHGEKHPVTVAEVDGEVVGWGALSPFRTRAGYRFTVEASIYVRHNMHRRGIGKAVLSDLIDRARKLGYHAMVGGTSADQAASVALQESMGFQKAGCLKEIGFKFDHWLDVVFMQLLL
jgi:phosphinothricin acetyltransferase